MFKKKFLTLNLALASLSIVATSISCTSNAGKDENKDHQAILIKVESKIKQQKVFTSKLTYAEMKEKFREFKKDQAIPWQDLKIVFPKLDSKIETKLTLIENISQQSKMLKVLLILKIANQETKQIINIAPTKVKKKKNNPPKQVDNQDINKESENNQQITKDNRKSPIGDNLVKKEQDHKKIIKKDQETNQATLDKLDNNKDQLNNLNSSKSQDVSNDHQAKQSLKANKQVITQKSQTQQKTELSDQQIVENTASRFEQAIKNISPNKVISLSYELGVKNLFEQKFKVANRISQAIEEMTAQQLNDRPKEYLGNKQMLHAAFHLPIDWKLFTNYEIKFYSKINFVKHNFNYQSGGYKIEYIFKKNKAISQKQSFFIKYIKNKLEKTYIDNKKIVQKSLEKLNASINKKGSNKILKLESKSKSATLVSEKQKYDKKFQRILSHASILEKNKIIDGYNANKNMFLQTYKSLGLDFKQIIKNNINFFWKFSWIPLTNKIESGGYEVKFILKKDRYISPEQKFFIKYAATKDEQLNANNQAEVNNIALSFEQEIIKSNKNLIIEHPWNNEIKSYEEQFKLIRGRLSSLVAYMYYHFHNNILLVNDYYTKRFKEIFPYFPVNAEAFTNKHIKFVFIVKNMRRVNHTNDKLPNDAFTISYHFIKDHTYISQERSFYIRYPWDDTLTQSITNIKADNLANQIKAINKQGIMNIPLDEGINSLQEQKNKILKKIKSLLDKVGYQEGRSRPSEYPGTRKMFFDCFSSLGLDWSAVLTHNINFYWRGIWIPTDNQGNKKETNGFKIEYVFKRGNVTSKKQSLFLKYLLKKT